MDFRIGNALAKHAVPVSCTCYPACGTLVQLGCKITYQMPTQISCE